MAWFAIVDKFHSSNSSSCKSLKGGVHLEKIHSKTYRTLHSKATGILTGSGFQGTQILIFYRTTE